MGREVDIANLLAVSHWTGSVEIYSSGSKAQVE